MTTSTLTRFVLALALSATACATAAKNGGTTTKIDTSILTAEEIAKSNQPTAFRAIQTARPQWLLVRRVGGSVTNRVETVKVYVQGSRQSGGIDALDQIAASTIKEMRRLDGRDATTRFGRDHGSGAILVTLR